jgi:hypothetical protein
MDNSENSIDPDDWRKSQDSWSAGYEHGKQNSERDSWERASRKRDSQLERASGATFFWALPFFILCSVYLESSYGWKNETAGWEILMVTSVVVLIFYLTLRAVIGKD